VTSPSCLDSKNGSLIKCDGENEKERGSKKEQRYHEGDGKRQTYLFDKGC
jgi:hypothetical protein